MRHHKHKVSPSPAKSKSIVLIKDLGLIQTVKMGTLSILYELYCAQTAKSSLIDHRLPTGIVSQTPSIGITYASFLQMFEFELQKRLTCAQSYLFTHIPAESITSQRNPAINPTFVKPVMSLLRLCHRCKTGWTRTLCSSFLMQTTDLRVHSTPSWNYVDKNSSLGASQRYCRIHCVASL